MSRHTQAAIERITPAHAGSTWQQGGRRRPLPDHPRARGEHALGPTTSTACTGSPPRTRGARGCAGAPWAPHRITPAHAGSTPRLPGGKKSSTDHPRARGEHDKPRAPTASTAGSPPRTRGAPRGAQARAAGHRITPAHAGSTGRPLRRCGPSPDHPRARGEHDVLVYQQVRYWGSPPRTRGARLRRRHGRGLRRITPAHAGSTIGCVVMHAASSDHPRARGEHSAASQSVSFLAGSPPRTRGALCL